MTRVWNVLGNGRNEVAGGENLKIALDHGVHPGTVDDRTLGVGAVGCVELHFLDREGNTDDVEARFGKESLLKIMYESEVSEQVYNSNAIENSTLSLEETDKILHQIDLDRFINERELFEAKNLGRVVEYIDKKAIEAELSVEVMLLLHQMIISNIRDEIAGRLRRSDEWVRVGSHIAADPTTVPELHQEMFTTYRASSQEIHLRNTLQRIVITRQQEVPVGRL